MTETSRPVVLSAATFTHAQLIDGGDTIVLQFEAPDGRGVAILVPRKAALALQPSLAAALAQPRSRDHDRD